MRWTTGPSIIWVLQALSSTVNRPWCEADHFCPSSTRLRMRRTVSPLPHMPSWQCLIKYSGNLILTLSPLLWFFLKSKRKTTWSNQKTEQAILNPVVFTLRLYTCLNHICFGAPPQTYPIWAEIVDNTVLQTLPSLHWSLSGLQHFAEHGWQFCYSTISSYVGDE
jgi:hypothetical protein